MGPTPSLRKTVGRSIIFMNIHHIHESKEKNTFNTQSRVHWLVASDVNFMFPFSGLFHTIKKDFNPELQNPYEIVVFEEVSAPPPPKEKLLEINIVGIVFINITFMRKKAFLQKRKCCIHAASADGIIFPSHLIASHYQESSRSSYYTTLITLPHLLYLPTPKQKGGGGIPMSRHYVIRKTFY